MLTNCLTYVPDFLNEEQSSIYFNLLSTKVNWKQEVLKIYGKNIKTPRLTAFYGDLGTKYKYSGREFLADVWTNELMALKIKAESFCNHSFNSVLLNYYRDGNDSMGWHSDDEKELGLNPVICSVSFGAIRRFDFRNKFDNHLKYHIFLQSGSLLIMKGDLQHNWCHQIAKSKRVLGPRINLTFRYIH